MLLLLKYGSQATSESKGCLKYTLVVNTPHRRVGSLRHTGSGGVHALAGARAAIPRIEPRSLSVRSVAHPSAQRPPTERSSGEVVPSRCLRAQWRAPVDGGGAVHAASRRGRGLGDLTPSAVRTSRKCRSLRRETDACSAGGCRWCDDGREDRVRADGGVARHGTPSASPNIVFPDVPAAREALGA